MKNKEYNVGDVFHHVIDGENVELRVVSGEDITCMDCAFLKFYCYNWTPKCVSDERSDKTQVIFVRNVK